MGAPPPTGPRMPRSAGKKRSGSSSSSWTRLGEEGSYDIVEVIDCGDDKVAGRVARHVRGKASGVDADFEYWNVVTLRRGKWLRSEWFTDRAEALEAAGLRE